MTKFVIAMLLVGALLVSGLVGLLRGRRTPMASPEVLERVRKRNQQLEASDRLEGRD